MELIRNIINLIISNKVTAFSVAAVLLVLVGWFALRQAGNRQKAFRVYGEERGMKFVENLECQEPLNREVLETIGTAEAVDARIQELRELYKIGNEESYFTRKGCKSGMIYCGITKDREEGHFSISDYAYNLLLAGGRSGGLYTETVFRFLVPGVDFGMECEKGFNRWVAHCRGEEVVFVRRAVPQIPIKEFDNVKARLEKYLMELKADAEKASGFGT